MDGHALGNKLTVLMSKHRFLFMIWNEVLSNLDEKEKKHVAYHYFERALIREMDNEDRDRLDQYAIRICMGYLNEFKMKSLEEELGIDIDGDGKIGRAS